MSCSLEKKPFIQWEEITSDVKFFSLQYKSTTNELDLFSQLIPDCDNDPDDFSLRRESKAAERQQDAVRHLSSMPAKSVHDVHLKLLVVAQEMASLDIDHLPCKGLFDSCFEDLNRLFWTEQSTVVTAKAIDAGAY